MSSNKEDEGKIEMYVRVLGNELIGFKRVEDDFKMKWLMFGVITIVALTYAFTTFGPSLMSTFSS